MGNKGTEVGEILTQTNLQSTEKLLLGELMEKSKAANEIFILEKNLRNAETYIKDAEKELERAMGQRDKAQKALEEKKEEKEPREKALAGTLAKLEKNQELRQSILRRMVGMAAIGKFPIALMKTINAHLRRNGGRGIGPYIDEAIAFLIVRQIPAEKLIDAGVEMIADMQDGQAFNRPKTTVENGEKILKVARIIAKEARIDRDHIRNFEKFLGEKRKAIENRKREKKGGGKVVILPNAQKDNAGESKAASS
jgi:hypothetical protein